MQPSILANAVRWSWTSLFVAMFTVASLAQDQPGKQPSLGSRIPAPDQVDQIFAPWDRPDSAGCAAAAIREGRIVYSRGYGMADLGHNIPIFPATVFDIASMDKQFIAMSILLLANQGKLSLDDELQKYVPAVPRYQHPTNLRHLIHHTSGIRDYFPLAALAGMGHDDLRENHALSLIVRQSAPDFSPGDEYLYSNSGYFLLALIVERVSGQTMQQFAEENIFRPLEMHNTRFSVARTAVVKNRATGYFPDGGGGFAAVMRKREGLDSTVEDLFRWDQNFYNNRLEGGPDLIRRQLSTGKLNNGEDVGYAFGLNVGEHRGLKVIGHGGYGAGFNSGMWRYPEQQFSVICLCNADSSQGGPDSAALTAQIVDVFLADQIKTGAATDDRTAPDAPELIAVSEKELATLAGLYRQPITGKYIHFSLEDRKLKVAWDTGYVLSPVSEDRFIILGLPGTEIVFRRGMGGAPGEVRVIDPGNTTRYEQMRGESLASARLAEFAGTYVSHDLAGAVYKLDLEDRELVLAAMGRKNIVLKPASADVFFIVGLIQWYPGEPNRQLATVKFTRDQQNAITGFGLSREPEGPKNLRFDRVHGSPVKRLDSLLLPSTAAAQGEHDAAQPRSMGPFDADWYGTISRDGRHLTYVQWETGDLVVRDLKNGEMIFPHKFGHRVKAVKCHNEVNNDNRNEQETELPGGLQA